MKKEYKGLKLLTLMLVLALVLALTVVSAFSWYDRTARPNETGSMLSYEQTGKVNNTSGVTVVTYAGTYTDGKVEYSDTPFEGAVDVKAGQPVYFKSVVTDTQNAGGAVVSLYMKDMSYASGFGNKINIGLVNSEKTLMTVNGTTSGGSYVAETFCLEDNIIVESNGTVEVEWFITSSQSVTETEAIKLGTMYIAYN